MTQIRRNIESVLHSWMTSENRKPLLLRGARQIGKTWLMRSFGRANFEHVAEFNFDHVPELASVFEKSKDVERILKELSLYTKAPVVAGKTLIIFDEIQECEAALNSLKYFCEDAPEYHVIAAGSLLGMAVRAKRMKVPVGKVQVLRMYPISFSEYLQTADASTWNYVRDHLRSVEPLPEIVLSRLQLEYKRYMVCGGMPEAAAAMLQCDSQQKIDDVLQSILDLYEMDFAKYATPVQTTRISSLWKSLPSQLAKQNKKFVYNVVKQGARARDYEDALIWLEESGLVYRVYDVSKPAMPLSAYKDLSAFKLYACDGGLLRQLAKLPAEIVMDGNSNYLEFRGAMAENMVLLSCLHQFDDVPYYWTSGNTAEIDFVVQHKTDIVPVEVKSEQGVHSRSLSVYREKFTPSVSIRFSMRNLQSDGSLVNCPLPLADWIWTLLEQQGGETTSQILP